MKYKAIFSDIDGTLLNSKHEVTKETIKTIQAIVSKGVEFILVSARKPEGIIPLQKKIGINGPIICFSGALILGSENTDKTREIIENTYMKACDAEEIYNLIKKDFHDVSFSLYQKDEWFAESMEDRWIAEEASITNSQPLVQKFKFLFNSKKLQINKILCISASNRIDELNDRLKKCFPTLTINKSKDTYLEIMACDVLKSYAVKVLQQYLNLNQNEIMAVGDNFNDMDMIEYAGLGVAMGNSPEAVKAIANDITATNDADGLKQVIEKYF